jgi:hypothetical protein
MAKYLVLIYEDEKLWESADDQTNAEALRRHIEFQTEHGQAVAGAHALEFTSTATSIRPDDRGGFVVTDGPFFETKEALCGVYLIEAANDTAAVEIARKVPAPYGGVEVRKIRVFEPS